MLHEGVGMMWLLYVLLGTLAHAQYHSGDDSRLDRDLYHTDEITSTPTTAMLTEDQLVTLRRLISRSTLYREQLADVKDALKVLMQNRVMDDMFLSTVGFYRDTDPDTSWHPVPNNILLEILNKLNTTFQSKSQGMQSRTSPLLRGQVDAIPWRWSTMKLSLGIDDYTDDYDSTNSIVPTRTRSSFKSSVENNEMAATAVVAGVLVTTRSMDQDESVYARRMYEDYNQEMNNSDYLEAYGSRRKDPVYKQIARQGGDTDPDRDPPTSSSTTSSTTTTSSSTTTTPAPNTTTTTTTTTSTTSTTSTSNITTKPPSTKRSTRHTRMRKTWRYTYSTTRTKSRRKKTRYRTTTTTTTTTTTPMILNIPRLIEIITNLTLDYSNNLTLKMNKTLQDMKIFTCPTAVTLLVTRKEVGNYTTTPAPTTIETTTIETTTVTPDPYTNLTGTIMGKCFVCGLEEPGMPRHARCADAFSGDFIPLVPVEATARKKLAEYRKYCRWMNVPRYVINQSDPRSVWGRWTGGCSVRWVDVTGIYTQRTCRNRHRAVMGQHWASKRMAKLEMALQRMDQGCIISPMSSLVPLSRGVSLYARFHACVCTGSWCNHAALNTQCTARVIGTLLILLLGTVNYYFCTDVV